MSINLTDEIEVKTKKGKLGAAKQIFLEGDTQTVENEIQDINSRHNDLNSKHESLSSTVYEHTNQIESNQNQIIANKSTQDAKNASLDANMADLNTRDDQITELVRGITATGGASVATTVTYDNISSHLASATVQGAIDELQGSKIDKTSILQELGNAEDKVMSQKAVSDKLSEVDGKVDELEGYLSKNVIGDCVELKGRLIANGAYEQRPDLAMRTYIIRVNSGDTMVISGEASFSAAYNFYNAFDGTTLSAINLIGTAQPVQSKGSAPFDLSITAPEECYLALCSKNTYENIAIKVSSSPFAEIDKLREYTEFNIGKLIHKDSLEYSSIDEELILKNGYYALVSGKITFLSNNNYVSSQCFDVRRISKIYVRTYLPIDYYGIVAFDNEMNIIDSLCQKGMNEYRWYEYDIPANVSYIAISGNSYQRDTMCLSINKKTYGEQSINIGVNNDYSDIDFVHGNIDKQGNIYGADTVAWITKFPIKTSPSIKRIVIDGTFESTVYLYDNELNLVSSQILSSNGIFTNFGNAEYFVVRVNPKTSIPLSRKNFNIEYDILSWIEQYKPVNIDDKTLLAGIAISHYTTELMAHCSTIVNGNDGFFYIPYYASDTTSVETFGADIQCRLAKVSQYNFNNCEIINVLRKGEVVGDYTQSDINAPYDPNVFIVGDVIRYIMVISDARGVALGYRDINKNTLALEDSIGLCRIKYGSYDVEMTKANLGVMLDRHFGTTGGSIGTYPILTNTIVKSGEWSYCILSGLGATNNFTGCIVKTQDGITWEVVAWCNDVYTSADGDPMWEAAIAIENNKVFVYFKGTDAPIAYYNMDTNSWSNLVYLMGYKGGGYNTIDSSRPSLVVIQNRVIAVQNVLPRYNGKFRSQVDFCHIDEDLSVVSRKTMYAPNGCHYMSFANIGDANYMCYTEDKSGRNNLNKGNISIIRIEL